VSFKTRHHSGKKPFAEIKIQQNLLLISETGTSFQRLCQINFVQDFLMGKNALLFTYGANSAGKAYTMLGNVEDEV
jgi:hypothetical protein